MFKTLKEYKELQKNYEELEKKILTREKEYDELLKNSGFLRVHQSHLINLAFVDKYVSESGWNNKGYLDQKRNRKHQKDSSYLGRFGTYKKSKDRSPQGYTRDQGNAA